MFGKCNPKYERLIFLSRFNRSSIKVYIIQKQWQLLQTKLNKVKEAQNYEQNQEIEIRQTGKRNSNLQNISRTGKLR